MDKACRKCKATGCCFNCTKYISAFHFETMIHINCSEYKEVATQERGYPIINGEVETNCVKWEREVQHA